MKPPRLATCDQALPTGLAASGAPEWVHLMPAGRVVARDGRSFELVDPAAVIRSKCAFPAQTRPCCAI